jgi:hypothetical protein
VTELEITDAHDSDGLIPSEIPSVKILPMIFVLFTNRINSSVKLFNAVVYITLRLCLF